ncbi:MAG: 16S rRNA (adenine(1518)-N(6)/adenine(1519)-N(6))-dimethyltransferase RsmA [Candidatus Aenigmatarchaeota archaeon]
MNVVDFLRKHNIEPKEYSDQFFLTDEDILKREADYANLNNEDVVLEIGPGIGNLTEKLISKAKKVIVIERDKRFCEMLENRNVSNLKILRGDFLNVDIPRFDKVVSNIPYGISSPLTLRLLELEWKTAVLTYQKEFAERFISKPGESDYSRLSVLIQYFTDVELLENIPKSKFFPQPDVDSAIVRLKQKRVKDGGMEPFWKFVRECFRHKNKKVKNSLIASKNILDLDEDYLKSKSGDIFEKKVFMCDIDDLEKLFNILRKERVL